MSNRHYVPVLKQKPIVDIASNDNLRLYVYQILYSRRGYLCVSQAIRMMQYYYPALKSLRIAEAYNKTACLMLDVNWHVTYDSSYIPRGDKSKDGQNPVAGKMPIPNFPLYQW